MLSKRLALANSQVGNGTLCILGWMVDSVLNIWPGGATLAKLRQHRIAIPRPTGSPHLTLKLKIQTAPASFR